MFLMRRLLCILLILMHIVEINICMYFIFWKIILNHENVLLASLLHPADLDALFWKTLKNVEHMPYLIVIFVYWGLIFFSWLNFFTKGTNKSSALVALMSNIRYDRCPMFCFFVIVMFKFCQLTRVSNKCWSMAPLVTFTHITMEWLKSLFQRNTFPLFTYVAIS